MGRDTSDVNIARGLSDAILEKDRTLPVWFSGLETPSDGALRRYWPTDAFFSASLSGTYAPLINAEAGGQDDWALASGSTPSASGFGLDKLGPDAPEPAPLPRDDDAGTVADYSSVSVEITVSGAYASMSGPELSYPIASIQTEPSVMQVDLADLPAQTTQVANTTASPGSQTAAQAVELTSSLVAATEIDDVPLSAQPDVIQDMLLSDDGTPVVIDLNAVFGAGATNYVLTNDAGAIVDAQISGGILTLSGLALGHSDLTITATVNGAPVTENFRAIVAGPNSYVFAILPDSQDYTWGRGSIDVFDDLIDWLIAQQQDLSIEHVFHVGDITQFGGRRQWTNTEASIEKLDGVISYTLSVGNHDQQRFNTTSADTFESDIDNYYTPDQVGATAAQGGGTYDGYDTPPDTFSDGNTYSNSIRNHYSTMQTSDGTNWLFLSLEFGAPDDVLVWAGEVIEAHLDHLVIITTHAYMGGSTRVGPTTAPLTSDTSSFEYGNGGWDYGIRDDPRNVNDGEDIWRELVSQYSNILFVFSGHNFGGGAETMVSYGAGGNAVYQILVNYQNSAWSGVSGLTSNGGHGAVRLIVIDPDNGRVTTHTKLTELDIYYEDYPDHQEVFDNVQIGQPEEIALARAGGTDIVTSVNGIDASVALDPSGTLGDTTGAIFEWFTADGEKLGETNGSALVVDLQTGTHRLVLQVTDQNGKVSTEDKVVIVEAPGALLTETFDDGDLTGWVLSGASSGAGTYLLKGSLFNSEDGQGEAALYQQSDGAEEILVWQGAGATGWSDYTFDMSFEAADNDTIGAVFYYTDPQNYYALKIDQETNTRTLSMVSGGVETILATETGSYRHFAMQDLRIAVLGDTITITLDDEVLFDGPIQVGAPLSGGTIGVLSEAMNRVEFDNLSVNPITLAARALTLDPADKWIADLDGDGTETITVSAAASLSSAGIATVEWLIGGVVVATGMNTALSLSPGETQVTLRVTDVNGDVSQDLLTLSVADNASVLVSDDFSDGNLNGWTIVDEGTLNGPSDWQVVNGTLVQASDIASTQQSDGAASYSVEGDGAYILRDGTYALWDDPAALSWTNYAISVSITPNDDDGIGLLFRYTDPDNYYKLEADAETGLVTLTRHLNGRESILARGYIEYTPGVTQQWRIEVIDGVITAYIDGHEVFGATIEDRELATGTVGLYSWGSQNLTFDDVVVVALDTTLPGANNRPVALDDNAAVSEDSSVEIAVLANDSDSDGDVLSIASFGQGASGTVTQTALGLTYTPNANFFGVDSFSYVVSDGRGGTDTATVTVVVNAINDLPVAMDDAGNALQNGSVEIDVLANDSDVDGDILSISGFGQGANGTVTQTAGGLTYTPDANFNGQDSFTYTVADGNGGSDTAIVTVTVAQVNTAPTAFDDLANTAEDVSVEIDVLLNDDDPDGDVLVVSAFGQASNGTVTQTAGGLTYTPDANFNGQDSFTYTVSDGQGGTDSAVATVSVSPVNDAPVGVDDLANTSENTAVEIDVLANDSDVDGDILSISGFGQGANGTVTQTAGGLTYTPDANFNGQDSFTYTVADGNGGSDVRTVTVTVDPLLNFIIGTNGNDVLTGTNGDDWIDPLGGRLDIVTGLAGADTFDFSSSTTNGVRDTRRITDYSPEDTIIVQAGVDVQRSFVNNGNTVLVLTGDRDLIVLEGVTGIDPDSLF